MREPTWERLNHGNCIQIERRDTPPPPTAAGTATIQLHERAAQVHVPNLARARIVTLLQGPCWCQGISAELSSFGLSRHRSIDLGGFDRHILDVDIAVEECISGFPASLLAAVRDHLGGGMTPRSVLSTSASVEN